MGTLIVGTVVFGLLSAAVYKLYWDKKGGKNLSGGCNGGDCMNCPAGRIYCPDNDKHNSSENIKSGAGIT